MFVFDKAGLINMICFVIQMKKVGLDFLLRELIELFSMSNFNSESRELNKLT